MAWCKLEDTVRHHYKFSQLARALGIRRAEARGLFLGLCSWACVNAPDGLLTGLTRDDIEEASDWQGRNGRLVEALISVGLLDACDDKSLEIHDFYERAESHKAAQKKRVSRDRTRTVPGQSPDCTPLEERRGEERRGEESGLTKKTKAIDPAVDELIDFHRRLLRSHRSLEPSTIVSEQTKKHARTILKHWPNDWQSVLEFFVGLTTDGLKRNKWPIGWLAKYADDYDTQFQNRKQTGAKTVDQIEAEAAEYDRMLQRRAAEAEGA